jgi:imidazoleglycerol phosphate dehydratase HisB
VREIRKIVLGLSAKIEREQNMASINLTISRKQIKSKKIKTGIVICNVMQRLLVESARDKISLTKNF